MKLEPILKCFIDTEVVDRGLIRRAESAAPLQGEDHDSVESLPTRFFGIQQRPRLTSDAKDIGILNSTADTCDNGRDC